MGGVLADASRRACGVDRRFGEPDGVSLYAGRLPDDTVEIRLDSGAPSAVEDGEFFLVAINGELTERPQTIEAFDEDGELFASANG